jgi:hypothetical protein
MRWTQGKKSVFPKKIKVDDANGEKKKRSGEKRT